MNDQAVHTSDAHRADRIWLLLGGSIEPVRRTGEKRYIHNVFERPLRTNGRRHDVPAKLLTRINQLMKLRAANDYRWVQARENPPPSPGNAERVMCAPLDRATPAVVRDAASIDDCR